jgi:hypothetical protein
MSTSKHQHRRVRVALFTLTREQAENLEENLHWDEGAKQEAERLKGLPEMRPYWDVCAASFEKRDATSAVKAIAALPLEKRYVWRMAKALAFAVADFDSWIVRMDRGTLDAEQIEELNRRLGLFLRPRQLALLVAVLFGTERMEELFIDAIEQAKQDCAREGWDGAGAK